MNALVEMVRAELAANDAGPLAVARGAMGKANRDRNWPVRVAAYIAHVGLGVSQREAGRMVGREPKVVREACAQVEDRRDDPAFDALMDRLADKALASYA